MISRWVLYFFSSALKMVKVMVYTLRPEPTYPQTKLTADSNEVAQIVAVLQLQMNLGKDGPRTVDVEQLAVGEILHHFFKTLDVLSAGLVDAVVELQCVDLCGGHGLDVLLRFQQARLLRTMPPTRSAAKPEQNLHEYGKAKPTGRKSI